MNYNAIKIDKRHIGYKRPPYVIAEAGVNHNGKIELAKHMIIAAKKAGANAIKFQTFKATEVTVAHNKMATYQQENTRARYNQLTLLKKLELKDDFYPSLIKLSQKVGITFLSAPHGGFKSIDLLNKYNIAAFKFGSGDLTNFPALIYAAKFGKPMIISTGMATLDEVTTSIKEISKTGNRSIIVLHATTNYPCPTNEVNLNAMITMINKLSVPVGYSDHTLGIHVPLMAATLGACLIEKHFTLDRNMPGPDHKASATFTELKQLCEQLNLIPTILGKSTKIPTKSELKMLPRVRKSIVSLCEIQKGEPFTINNIAIKRPGTGVAPKHFVRLLSKTAKKKIRPDQPLSSNDYE